MTEKEKATPASEAALQESRSKSTRHLDNNSAAAQRARALALLRSGPKSTLQLRREGDILSPAGRVLELKRRGIDILTQWVHEATDAGKLHRVALYVLLRESGGQA